MESKCSKCKIGIPPDTKKPITCDICKVLFCKGCSQLSSSEVKVIELAQRRMIYSCSECNNKPNENEKYKEIKKLMQVLNDMIVKTEENYIQKVEHLLNVIEQRDINMKDFVKEQIYDLKKDIDSYINKLDDSTHKNKMENNEEVHKKTMKKQSISTAAKIMATKTNIHKSTSPIITKTDKPTTSKNYYELQQAQREIANRIINLGQIDSSNNTNSSNVGETPTCSLTPLEKEQVKDKDNFIQVTNKKKWKRRGNIGTGEDNQDNQSNFEGSAVWKNQKHWVIIKKVKDNADTNKIKEYLKNKLNVKEEEDIAVKWLDTYHKIKDNNCYLIGFDKKYMNNIYEPKLWPKGVVFDRFDFQKGQRFLDNPRFKRNGVGIHDDELHENAEDFHTV